MDPQVQAYLNGLDPQKLAAMLARQGMTPEEYMPHTFGPALADPGAIAPAPAFAPDSSATTWPGLTAPPLGPVPVGIDALPQMKAQAQAAQQPVPPVVPQPAPQPTVPAIVPNPIPFGVAQQAAGPGAVNPLLMAGLDRLVSGQGPQMPEGAPPEAPKPRAASVSSRNAPTGYTRPKPRPKPAPKKGFRERLKAAWKTRGKDMQELAKARMLKASRR